MCRDSFGFSHTLQPDAAPQAAAPKPILQTPGIDIAKEADEEGSTDSGSPKDCRRIAGPTSGC